LKESAQELFKTQPEMFRFCCEGRLKTVGGKKPQLK